MEQTSLSHEVKLHVREVRSFKARLVTKCIFQRDFCFYLTDVARWQNRGKVSRNPECFERIRAPLPSDPSHSPFVCFSKCLANQCYATNGT